MWKKETSRNSLLLISSLAISLAAVTLFSTYFLLTISIFGQIGEVLLRFFQLLSMDVIILFQPLSLWSQVIKITCDQSDSGWKRISD